MGGREGRQKEGKGRGREGKGGKCCPNLRRLATPLDRSTLYRVITKIKRVNFFETQCILYLVKHLCRSPRLHLHLGSFHTHILPKKTIFEMLKTEN